MSRKVLDRLSDATVVALRVVGDDWPHALLSTTLIPDNWMGLVLRPDGRRRFVPAGEDPRPDRDDKLLLVRNRPITVPITVEDARAADDHYVTGSCELLVRWHACDDDLAALQQTLLDRGELLLDGLAQTVANAGAETALREFIRQRQAAALVHKDLRAELLASLQEQLKRLVFSSGMTLERVATLELSSPSLARQEALRRDTAARVERIKSREMVEAAAAAATTRRLDDLSVVLEKLKATAARDDQMQWHDLLPALTPAERGRLLEQLWRITPDHSAAEAIVVVAGRECVWLDPSAPDQVVRRVELDEGLGGLRSVTFSAERNLLPVGAARGVWTVDASDGSIKDRYEVPSPGEPRTGFNAAVVAGDRLFATHSELGVWCWALDSPDKPEARLTPVGGVPRAIRAATATDDGRVLIAADDTVHVFGPDETSDETLPRAGGTLRCLAVEEQTVYAGTTAGELLALNLERPDAWTSVHRTTAAFESVLPRRWNDLLELVIPAGRAVHGVFAQAGIVARLMETPVRVRRAWACDDLLVALSENRDRLIVMKSDSTERTGREVLLARDLGHSVQDVCIVLRHVGEPA